MGHSQLWEPMNDLAGAQDGEIPRVADGKEKPLGGRHKEAYNIR